MKKLLYILLVALTFSSCEEFLEEEPTALVSDATFYITYDQSIVGIATAYAEMRSEGRDVLHNIDMPSDICSDGDYFDWLWTTTSHPEAPYSAYYKVIAEANVAIEKAQINAEEIDASLSTSTYASPALKASGLVASKIIEGEARFIRGLMYFKLVSYYGDVPLILKSFVSGDIPTDLVRAPKDSVYALARSDMQFAAEYCALKEMVPSGRVTQAAAAGMLAKLDLYWASITIRDEKYWDKNLLPAQPENKAGLRAELYAEALEICNNIINGDYGIYQLENYYPAASGAYFSNEHLLAMHSLIGAQTKVYFHEGWAGGRGRRLTHYAPFLWDFPTWEDQWDTPKKIYDLELDGLNNLLIDNDWTLTGDTTRRLWSCIMWRGNPDPPQTQYWTVYEPLGRFLGEEFYAPPGLGAAPYENYPEHTRTVFNDNNGSWTDQIWTAAGRQLTDPEIWRIDNSPNGYTSGKFRLNWPYGPDWEESNYDHTFPVLRLAEIYLLRAEVKFFLANEVLTSEAIEDIDVIRGRAQNQAPLRELMLYGGKQSANNIIKADSPPLFQDILPSSIPGDKGLKILLDERVRELSNENNTRWFDMQRFPQIIIPNMHEMSLQEQPLKSGIASGDNYYTTSYYMEDRFGVETNLYMLYLPLPESEVEFYPGLKQTYGYY